MKRSFEVGNQVLISSHRKLLLSKAMVVNVAEKSEQRFRQARLREASASEPLQKLRKEDPGALVLQGGDIDGRIRKNRW
jgi:hypothetical protein